MWKSKDILVWSGQVWPCLALSGLVGTGSTFILGSKSHYLHDVPIADKFSPPSSSPLVYQATEGYPWATSDPKFVVMSQSRCRRQRQMINGRPLRLHVAGIWPDRLGRNGRDPIWQTEAGYQTCLFLSAGLNFFLSL